MQPRSYRRWPPRATPGWPGLEQVAIDPFTPYAKAIRHLLPHARLIVDKFHVLRLFARSVDLVRRRTVQQAEGRRGRETGTTNAATESCNRKVKRVACGFRNHEHYVLRIEIHAGQKHYRPDRGPEGPTPRSTRQSQINKRLYRAYLLPAASIVPNA